MSESFDISVIYKNNELSFQCTLFDYGYSYKIAVEVDDHIIHFERDDQQNLRAIDTHHSEKGTNINVELIKIIGEELIRLFG